MGKRENANGLCNPLIILFRWIFSWLLKLLILFASIAVCGKAFQYSITLCEKKYLRISRCITFFSSFIVCPLVPSYGALEKRSFQSIPSMILYTSIRSPRILLVSRIVRFSFFSLISYGNLFSSGMHFVNRHWTPSNSLISLILFGHQACTAYSRCGLTILLYNNNIVFLSLYWKDLLIIPNI